MQKLNRVFQLRISETDLNLAKRLAAQNKMTLADFIRCQIFDNPIKTVQSTLDLNELKRQGVVLKQVLTNKRISHNLEEEIRKHLKLLETATKIWIKANDS